MVFAAELRVGVETVGSILTGQHRDLRCAVGFRSG